MVEHDGVGQRQQPVGMFDEVGAERIELHMPAVLGDPRRQHRRQRRQLRAARRRDEADAAHAELVEADELGRRDVVSQQRHTAEPIRKTRQCIGQHRVVAPIGAAAQPPRRG